MQEGCTQRPQERGFKHQRLVSRIREFSQCRGESLDGRGAGGPPLGSSVSEPMVVGGGSSLETLGTICPEQLSLKL